MPRTRSHRVSVAWLALALLAQCVVGCSEEPRTLRPPQLIVRVHSTAEVRAALDTVRITAAVEIEGGGWRVRRGVDVPIEDQAWPIDIPVVPTDPERPTDRFEVVVEAVADDEVLVQARSLTHWFEGGVRILDVWLIRCGEMALGELCEPDPECHGDECQACIDPVEGFCDRVIELAPDTLRLYALNDPEPMDLLYPPGYPEDAGADAGALDAGRDSGLDTGTLDPCAELDCDDTNPCTVDGCDPANGCTNDGTGVTSGCAPDDNCNSGYVCQGDYQGTCAATTRKDCSAMDSACHIGVCDLSDASCKAMALADTSPCNDANSCTPTSACASGQCVGSGNACGPNATACTPGSPNGCTCANDYLDNGAGQCVPTIDECQAGVCVVAATCFDPTSAFGDASCTCPLGFSGDGRVAGNGCTDIDECEGNPCGAHGSCTQGTPGSYACNCNSSYTEVAGSCVCDLNGTFATRIAAEVRWADVAGVEDSGTPGPIVYSWALWQASYDATGTLDIEVLPCGGTVADLCADGTVTSMEAYGQWMRTSVWDEGDVGVSQFTVNALQALPGAALLSPLRASLVGIWLNDPLGAWPSSRAQVDGTLNGAMWVDADLDGLLGATSLAVPPGGVALAGGAGPIEAYPAQSLACPRSSGATRFNYTYWPALESITLRRVKRFHVASRTRAYYDGQLDSCDAFSGSVKGPDAGQMAIDSRIGGCVRDNAGADVACSSTVIDFLDGAPAASHVHAASFVAKRVSASATCVTARAASYP